ncbi:MAG: PAS domain S-box protein [Candidatus Hodarchaeales archaeon]|jgi:PAS domain S-box-containing protein
MPISVLHIDDDSTFLEITKYHLSKRIPDLKYFPTDVSNKALEIANEKNVDVIISDYAMPELNGMELLDQVRQKTSEKQSIIPFIILTGKSREEIVIQSLNLGADYYLQKGTDLDALYSQLESFIIKSVERKRIEEERIRLVAMAEQSQDFISVISPERKMLFLNKAGQRYIGVSGVNEAQKRAENANFQKKRKDLKELLDKIPEEGQWTGESIVGKLPVLLSAFKINHPVSDDFLGTGVIARDLTEIKKVEKQLRYRNELISLIMNEAIKFINLDDYLVKEGIINALKIICEFMHFDRAHIFEFDGKYLKNTYEWCTPKIESNIQDLQHIPFENVSWFINQLNDLKPVHFLRVMELPPEADMEKEIVELLKINSLLIIPMIYKNQLIGFIGFGSIEYEQFEIQSEEIALLNILGVIFVNIIKRTLTSTRLHESEERFRILTEGSFESIIVHDEGIIIDANENFLTLFGYNDLNEVIGKSVLEFTAPESKEFAKKRVLTQDDYSYKATGTNKDGSKFSAEFRAKSIPYQGKMVRIALIRKLS